MKQDWWTGHSCVSKVDVDCISSELNYIKMLRKNIELHQFGSDNNRAPDWTNDNNTWKPGDPKGSYLIQHLCFDFFLAPTTRRPASPTVSKGVIHVYLMGNLPTLRL